MIFSPRISHLLLSVFLCTSLTSAWPWPPSLPDFEGLLVRRADNQNTGSAATTKAAAQPSKTASPASNTAKGTAEATTAAKAKGTKATGTKAAGSAAQTTGQKAQPSSVDPRLPQGGVNMITPSALATSTYYKIGVDSVSFAWNYTSLAVTPSKIDVLVSCTANQATYTIASNASFEKTGSVVWDTRPEKTGEAPLLTETYTLIIHDAEKAVTEAAGAGHLGSYSQFQFGMYLPQTYTPRADWKCPVCSAAMSDAERQAIKFMFGMCGITILSFTWFVGGFGAIF